MRRSSWPCFTVSPRRARISTTRPEANVTTGTVRATSGYTAPFTTNFDGASYCAAVATGYRSGWSTEKCVTSRPGTTVVGGGASAATLFFSPHPEANKAVATAKVRRGHSLQISLLRIFASRTRLNPFANLVGYTPRVRTGYAVPKLPSRPTESLCACGWGSVQTERQK